jgi:AcrR family transcriptional regulator
MLDAAYACFTRHGVRRTTMDDLATEAGMSRPALYQHFRNKGAIFAALVEDLLATAVATAEREVADAEGLTDQVTAVLAIKLGLLVRLWRDSPAHAAELLAPGNGADDAIVGYERRMSALLVTALGREHPEPVASEAAALLLAFTRGLDVRGPAADGVEDRLRRGVRVFVAGLPALETPTTGESRAHH